MADENKSHDERISEIRARLDRLWSPEELADYGAAQLVYERTIKDLISDARYLLTALASEYRRGVEAAIDVTALASIEEAKQETYADGMDMTLSAEFHKGRRLILEELRTNLRALVVADEQKG